MIFAGIEGTPCTEDGPHITPDGQITDDPMACKHAHPAIPKGLVHFSNIR